MTRGSLPKGYSSGDKSHSEAGTIRFRILQASLVLLIIFIAVTGIFVALFFTGYEPSEEKVPGSFALITNFSLITWIVGIPLLIIVIIKYRKSELTSPTGFTKLYYRRREAHQCTICQKHPVSKKYHIKNEHKLKDVNVDDYFRDCGCDKCARYDKSEAG